MPLHAGDDRSWYEPYSPDCENGEDVVIGSHRGPTFHLNIRNPKPGYVYYYEANKANSLQRRSVEGWEFVSSSDPEEWGADLPEDVQTDIGGVKLNKDVVLMRIREDKYADLAADKERLATLARGGASDQFLDRGFDTQQRLTNLGISTGEDVFYKGRSHGETSE